MRMLTSFFHEMILSMGCLIYDRDSGSVMANEYEIVYLLLSRRDSLGGCLIDDRYREGLWPMNMRMLISYFHDMILSVGCSIDDRDCGSVMANEYENVDQLLSRHEVLWPMKMRLFT